MQNLSQTLDELALPADRGGAQSLAGPLTALKRHAERGAHDEATIFSVIDEARICHLAFSVDGQAVVLPTAHARVGSSLYVHGAKANRMLGMLKSAGRASATFTLLDGLVLARTAFHHSMNYRSVVVFGSVAEVIDLKEKHQALAALIEHLAPGRMAELAAPTDTELKATSVLKLSIEQASAKVRKGPPLDATADYDLDIWAGVVPIEERTLQPVRDPALSPQRLASQSAIDLGARSPSAMTERCFGEYLLSSDRSRCNFEWVHRYLAKTSYWARGISAEQLGTALEHSICFGIYRAGVQIGFARAVSDHARFAYLADVFVDEQHRSRGLGTALVEFMLEHPALCNVKRCLLGTQDAHGFYEKLGFLPDAQGRFLERVQEA